MRLQGESAPGARHDMVEGTRRLIAAWTGGDSVREFEVWRTLGCPYQDFRKAAIPALSSAPLEQIEACLQMLLPATIKIQKPERVASGLAGLFRYDLWANCMDTETSTYELACGLIVFLEHSPRSFTIAAEVGPDVLEMLNIWLNPDPPWAMLPASSEVAATLFGDVWCALNLPDGIHGDKDIGVTILRDRPLFQKGLCPTQSLPVSGPPSLDFPS
jgi:hypothetical protein